MAQDSERPDEPPKGESADPVTPEDRQEGDAGAQPSEEAIAPDEAGRSQAAEGAESATEPPEPDPGEETAAAEAPAANDEPAAEDPDGAEAPAPEDLSSPEDADSSATTPAQAQAATDEVVEAGDQAVEASEEDLVEDAPRSKPEIPGAHLEVDIVPEGFDPLGREAGAGEQDLVEAGATDETAPAPEPPPGEPEGEAAPRAVIDLASGARYRATGKRKTSVARVILRPGKGRYEINGRALEEHFPRPALQRNIRQPLETVGYDARMDVVAKLHGGGVSAQAGALRHGISRALIEADPNLRGELKRRGFLTRDPRVKERKKAGLKKARKRPQFSKR